MTVKVEIIEGGMPHNKILITGLIASLVCIYLTMANTMPGTYQLFSFFGGFAVVAAIWWGSDTIKHLCSYGIGTGVPSAGMVALGSGVIAMLFATKFGMLAPIVAVILAAVIGAIIGYTANNILRMHIPVMIISLVELAIVGAIIFMGFGAMMTGSFTFAGLTDRAIDLAGLQVHFYNATFIGGSLIATAFMLGAIAVQHPFNACLGPNWTQDRMLMLAAECGFISMIAGAIMSFALISQPAAIVSLLIAVICWAYTYKQYFVLSKRDAAGWLDSKPIPEPEGH